MAYSSWFKCSTLVWGEELQCLKLWGPKRFWKFQNPKLETFGFIIRRGPTHVHFHIIVCLVEVRCEYQAKVLRAGVESQYFECSSELAIIRGSIVFSRTHQIISVCLPKFLKGARVLLCFVWYLERWLFVHIDAICVNRSTLCTPCLILVVLFLLAHIEAEHRWRLALGPRLIWVPTWHGPQHVTDLSCIPMTMFYSQISFNKTWALSQGLP